MLDNGEAEGGGWLHLLLNSEQNVLKILSMIYYCQFGICQSSIEVDKIFICISLKGGES